MKGRKHRETGGFNAASEDLKKKNMSYTYEDNVGKEAEERKYGGRTKRKSGGRLAEGFGPEHEGTQHRAMRKAGGHVMKHVGEVEGKKAKHHMGRKARKSGGSCDSGNPFSSARKGEAPMGRKMDMEMENL